jgi:putative endonuclease
MFSVIARLRSSAEAISASSSVIASSVLCDEAISRLTWDCLPLRDTSRRGEHPFRNDTEDRGKSMSDRNYSVYIMTNSHNTVLYTGVTNNLYRRVLEHRSGKGGYFAKKYNVTKLVYYEFGDDINMAILREKQIKAGSRKKKLELINSMNPEWKDLLEEILG